MPYGIDRLIINSPYEEPKHHWKFNPMLAKFELAEGRRPAGYVCASKKSRSLDDPGEFVEIPLVNRIRPRVSEWRKNGYIGVTPVTRRLLEHWNDPNARENRFFFAQIEAIETIIWLVEADESEKVGIEIPSDGGDFTRWCSKMATGTGKTVVMAMLIAWNTLNKVTYPNDPRFSKNILIVAPGLTVRERLQVLIPDSFGNYYDEFYIVPLEFREKMRMGKVRVINWHVLNPKDDTDKIRIVKKGPESDEAFSRRVLGDMASAKNILIINDEAHHAWRLPGESKVKGMKKEDIKEATVWIDGLDRIYRARGILRCHDFSATPFAPTGKNNAEDTLFKWIISDFGLNDAIESGLVKTPRVVIRDDSQMGKDFRSKFYHIYEHVKDNLNRKAKEEEPLPDIVIHAYYFLGLDWQNTYRTWKATGQKVPPVMITVCNRTETAARVKYAFIHKQIRIDELNEEKHILHIDSKVLKKAENPEEDTTTKDRAESLRKKVATVGKEGEPGEQVRLVISVGMLSEGWDAKTVTHILGLRAFSSQLLCEQVVGRGLRRTSYEINEKTGMFDPEYVNIFGVPFSFIPHEGSVEEQPKPPKPKVYVSPLLEKSEYEIKWPNIIRINHSYRPLLTLDISSVPALNLKASETPTLAELAPVIDGKPDVTRISEIDLEKLVSDYRLQRVIFEVSRDVYHQIKPDWKGNEEYLLAQIIRLVEKFIKSNRIKFDTIFAYSEDRKRILMILNMKKIVQHIFDHIRFENTESIEPVFDRERPIRSTADMIPWYTGKKCEITKKSHISHVVYDSTWEKNLADELDRNELVDAWVKNDHLGFDIIYISEGRVRKYRPDFLVRLKGGKHLILEVKGKKTLRDEAKLRYLNEWVRAVNEHGGFGVWGWNIIENIADIKGILEKHASGRIS